MSWKLIYLVLLYLAAAGYCQDIITTTIPTILKSELQCRGFGVNCNKKVNRCPTNQECIPENLCFASRLSLTELLVENNKYKTSNLCSVGETCCDISNTVRDEYCPTGQKCTSRSICTAERLGLLDIMKASKINNTAVATENPNGCPNDEVCCDIDVVSLPLNKLHVKVNRCPTNQECIPENLCIASRLSLTELLVENNKYKTSNLCSVGETCCDISNTVRDEYCPTGQKCTSRSICTAERLGLLDIMKASKINNTAVVTENPNGCPNDEVCCDIDVVSLPLNKLHVKVNRCPTNQECIPENLCIASRLSLTELLVENNKNKTSNLCSVGETCCDISNTVRDEYCPTGQKCTSRSICTAERLGLLDIMKASKINNTAVVTENPNGCPNDEVCCDIDVVSLPLKCGLRNINGIGLESKQNIGDAEFGEFPWTLVVLKKEIFGDKILSIYLGSGSLIHPSVALTSAHSISGKIATQLQIRAGDWNLNTTNEIYPDEVLDVESIVFHEQFSTTNLRNDVALLFLQGEFEKKSHINVICLPPKGYIFDHTRCFASGWGKDKIEEDGKYQVEMKKSELAIFSNDVCQTKLRQTRLGSRYRFHDSFICAGGEGVDLCKGSGGSPLVCPIEGSNENYYQAGISSWGIGCGSIGVPGVYGNVSHFKEWIDQNMISKGFTTESYTY